MVRLPGRRKHDLPLPPLAYRALAVVRALPVLCVGIALRTSVFGRGDERVADATFLAFLLACLTLQEHALALATEAHGAPSAAVGERAEALCGAYNALDMRLVEREEFERALALLRKAEVLAEGELAVPQVRTPCCCLRVGWPSCKRIAL